MQIIKNESRETIWSSKRRITSPKQLFYELHGYPQISSVLSIIIVNKIYILSFLFGL